MKMRWRENEREHERVIAERECKKWVKIAREVEYWKRNRNLRKWLKKDKER